MMPSFSQVLDHHLFISKIISGVEQFHHWAKREELGKNSQNAAYPKKRATAGKHRSCRRGEEKSSRSSWTRPNKLAAAYQKTTALVSLLAENR